MARDPEHDVELQKLDEISVRSIWEIQERHTVSITGSVREPGTYEYLGDMTVMDLIFRAGGLKESAYKQEAEVSRVDSTTIVTKQAAEVFRVPISANYGLPSTDTTFTLQQWDQVFIREIPDWQLQRNVKVTGEVVAASLGHESFNTTARPYAGADAVAGARVARVVDALN